VLNTGPGDAALRRGQRVRLSWPPDAAHPLAQDAETSQPGTTATSRVVPTSEEGTP
jgi:hypothetical protein